ncbi:MAG: apolipoprotein N-acyltransferase [Desulfobacterales bacterium]|nr:MAG: apolipoprotein N-acyltransferase [Desulfobacterales bacterium]
MNTALAVGSGLLLTGSFPTAGMDGLAWLALVPLLLATASLGPRASFRLGLMAGIVHFLTLLYWLAYTMRTYGYLPWYLCIPILFLLTVVLAQFVGVFSLAVSWLGTQPGRALIMIPVLWVALEYIRSFFLSGFPWELIGYSQFKRLHVIQISDILGVYGVSFIIVLANTAIWGVVLHATRCDFQGKAVTRRLAAGSVIAFAVVFGGNCIYGARQIKAVDARAAASPTAQVAVVQGNIDQAVKWDPAFQVATVNTYNRLSLVAQGHTPALVVWPESATPFYLLYEPLPTEMVMRQIRTVGADFLIGSPSFARRSDGVDYYNSAYLIGADGKVINKYDKAHLVPYGEYTPFKKWLPFIGKMVEHVGDFQPGPRGRTLPWKDKRLGIQICYEIIFPDLARAQARNDANLLINITNDAWYGRTSAPYQHFSMTVFRAIENRRALARSANTGISGFIDPVGRIIAATPIFEEAVVMRTLPLMAAKSFYTQVGDLFARLCLTVSLLVVFSKAVRLAPRRAR